MPAATDLPDADRHDAVPLVLDLDGTLLKSDLLVESALALLRRNPFMAFAFLRWLAVGKANLKKQIADRADIDIAHLPWDKRVLAMAQAARGRRPVVLCTASDSRVAQAVASQLGCFDEVIASDGVHNLSGKRKADVLVARYGERGFDYAGNEATDLPVWNSARRAIVVNATRSVVRRASVATQVEADLPNPDSTWKGWRDALRPHQWIKNVLVFVPLLAAHRFFEPASILAGLTAFLAFGLCASSAYLLNDLMDLQADRLHPGKRHRPFASGRLPLSHGLVVAPALTLASFAIALSLSTNFLITLAIYYALTLAYSVKLKRYVMLDVVVLATLYTIRIIAGAVAVVASLSFWLLAFSMFLFLSLAMLKRYTELHLLLGAGRDRIKGRGYAVDDLSLVQSFGASSGYLAVLVLALYINSTASEALYAKPEVLWLLCPLLLYWISRAWMISHRGAMRDDPVVFAATDRTSLALVAVAALIVVGAM